MQPQELVDIHEAARMTGLNPQTLYRLARLGRIRKFRVLRRAVRFDRGDLLDLVRVDSVRLQQNWDSPTC